jgi:hypothetical protein
MRYPPPRPHSIVPILCHFLAAIDQVPRPPRANFPADGRIPRHPRDRFPAAQLLDRIDIAPRLDEPGRKGVTEVMEAAYGDRWDRPILSGGL